MGFGNFGRAPVPAAGDPAWKAPVRVVVTVDVANLSSFDVTTVTGVTLVKGERVGIVAKASRDGVEATSYAHGGIYVLGTVSGGLAPLTRATDAATAASLDAGAMFSVQEDIYSNASGATYVQIVRVVTLDTDALSFQQQPQGTESATIYWTGQHFFSQPAALSTAGPISITSTTTVAPTTWIFGISGSSGSYIDTITPPAQLAQTSIGGVGVGGLLICIPVSSGLHIHTGGNFARAVNLTINIPVILIEYASSWYPILGA